MVQVQQHFTTWTPFEKAEVKLAKELEKNLFYPFDAAYGLYSRSWCGVCRCHAAAAIMHYCCTVASPCMHTSDIVY